MADIASRQSAERAFAAQVEAVLHGGEERWQAAVAAWRGRRPALRAGRGAAWAWPRRGRRPGRRAAGTLSEATTIGDELGAAPLLESAETLARGLGLRAPGAAVVVAAGDEGAYRPRAGGAAVGGRGLQQQPDPASLYISSKTASVYVSRITAKLEDATAWRRRSPIGWVCWRTESRVALPVLQGRPSAPRPVSWPLLPRLLARTVGMCPVRAHQRLIPGPCPPAPCALFVSSSGLCLFSGLYSFRSLRRTVYPKAVLRPRGSAEVRLLRHGRAVPYGSNVWGRHRPFG